MTLSTATFTPLRGCLLLVDGHEADVSTKLSILREGACRLQCLDDPDWAESMNTKALAESGIFVCDEPRLVELAMRYHDWRNTEGNLGEEEAQPLDDRAATVAVMQWLARRAR
jgi:hypothetical protein